MIYTVEMRVLHKLEVLFRAGHIIESLPQNIRFWAETFQRNIQVEGISVAFLLGDICGVGLAHYTSNDITSTFSTTLDSQKHQAF